MRLSNPVRRFVKPGPGDSDGAVDAPAAKRRSLAWVVSLPRYSWRRTTDARRTDVDRRHTGETGVLVQVHDAE